LDYVNRQKCPKSENSNAIGSLEKKLLDTFNYYNREYKPFSIEKVHRHEGNLCERVEQNNLTLTRLQKKIFLVKKFPKSYLNNYSNHSSEHTHTYEADLNNKFNYSENCDRKKNLSHDLNNFFQNLRSSYLFNDQFNKKIYNNVERNFDFDSNGRELISFVENFPRSRVESTMKNNILDYNLIFQKLTESTHKFLEELTSNLGFEAINFSKFVNSNKKLLYKHVIQNEPDEKIV
jgi:hypothetical protein